MEVEATETVFFDRIGEHQNLVERLKRRLASELGVAFRVRLVEPKSLERSAGKVKRVGGQERDGEEGRVKSGGNLSEERFSPLPPPSKDFRRGRPCG